MCSNSVSADRESNLRHCRNEFLKKLEKLGYSADSIDSYRRVIDRFCDAVNARKTPLELLGWKTIVRLKEHAVNSRTGKGRVSAEGYLSRFLTFLTESGNVKLSLQPPHAETKRERLRLQYEEYLRVQRGLSESTIFHCVRFYERFMTFRFGEGLGDLNAITPDDVVGFLRKLFLGPGVFRDKTPPTHLRSLFKFLFWSGATQVNLANSIPRMAQPAASALPRSLTPQEVQRLLDAARSEGGTGRRNHAVLLLMARLGLRASEVVAIRLEDIHWRTGELLIRGKGKLHDRMPIPPDVGASLADYIQYDRKGVSRALFVLHRAPYRAFADGQSVNRILCQAFAKSGLKPPQKYIGSHVLRHSLATDMLRNGASLNEIGDVLRHRTQTTTAIYAKHDLESLRSVALAWPISGDVS